jgi:hypothetical protein
MKIQKSEEIAFRLEAIVKSIEDIPFTTPQQELIWRHIHSELTDIQEILEEDETYHKKVVVN